MRLALLLLASVLGGILLPFLSYLLRLPPVLGLVILPLALAVSVFVISRRLLYSEPLSFLLAILTLQVPAILLIASPLFLDVLFRPVLGFFSWLFDFIKFLIASVLLGFAFLVLFAVRSLGKPGAFFAGVCSMALASAIALKEIRPFGGGMGGGWEISPDEILLFILLSSLFLMAIALVGWERG